MEKRYAYQVWICGPCGGHLVELDGGELRCETCGYDFDGQGEFIPDPAYDQDYINDVPEPGEG